MITDLPAELAAPLSDRYELRRAETLYPPQRSCDGVIISE